MTSNIAGGSDRPVQASLSPVTSVVLVLCLVPELAFYLSEADLLGVRRLRLYAYEYGGFWPGLLGDWRPNYPAQPWLMFVTYGFLHTGPAHFIVNMITLFSLGRFISERGGELTFMMIYAGAILGGALGYFLLAPPAQPMVGASGALFGLAAAFLAWEYRDRRHEGSRLGPVYWMIALLILLNAVLWWAMNGHLAWQTHLGGAIAGAVIAVILPGRRTVSP